MANSDALAAVHARLLEDSSYQFDFSNLAMPKEPTWVRQLSDFLQNIAPIMKFVFWGIVAAIVLSILYFIGRELWLRYKFHSGKEARAAPRPQWRPTHAEAEHLLLDADALAVEGKYGEAVHLILLRSIQDIEKHRPAAVGPALTSREISLLRALPDASRGSFSTIMRIVERNLFGGADISAADFAAARAEYTRFAFPDAWAVAR